MVRTFTERKRFRKNFGRIKEVASLPNLIELQRASYDAFLHSDERENLRDDIGLRQSFLSSFPIKDNAGRAQLDFCDYHFDEPKYTEEECRNRGLTYSAALRAMFRLIVWDIDDETGVKNIKDIKEQDVYICDLPIMTKDGTFIINGVERVIVSQMQRSPGVFFDHDNGRTHSSGKYLFAAHIIPYKGAWLDIEFDAKDLIYIRIDRKRKILASTLLMALYSGRTEKLLEENLDSAKPVEQGDLNGMDKEEILNYFYDSYEVFHNRKGLLYSKFDPERFRGAKRERDLIDADSGSVVVEAGEKITSRVSKKLVADGLKNVVVFEDELIGKYNAYDIIDESTGIVIAEAGDELTPELLEKIMGMGDSFSVLCIDHAEVGAYIRNTLIADKCNNRGEALFDIFRIMRPGEPPTIDSAQEMFYNMFFNPDRYDLSAVGRVKMNTRLGISRPENLGILTKDDILRIVKILHQLKDGIGTIDDIDNLANRRVRSVGELLENQFRGGLARMERAIKERMASIDIESAVPNDIVNSKSVSSAVREFFGLSQLSQFMDQTNPLAEITHKRRISALGPGGLTRDRAGLDVRDVHPTHYGRICPIETPEGQNIGLINSLATFARINKYGFIEAPYRKVVDGVVTNEVVYLSAMEEVKYTIAQVNAALDSNGHFTDEFVNCRRNGDFINAPKDSIDFMDVSPKQIISTAAALIPFLENDDASRALMGANMQRQAVTLLRPQAPLVGTGMEAVVARDSGAAVSAKNDGVIDQVDAERIVIRRTSSEDSNVGVDIYNLRKFQRSNQSTCLNQRPLVRVGDEVKAGDIIADGAGTDIGELALGQNVLVGFMSWLGYTFEDAIVISERLVQDDLFTSIHIEEFEVMARDTKLGNEEITRDIPNVSDEALAKLDESGIVHIGAEVEAGDILVGKVMPKGESLMTPEEKLLRAIFGERAADVKDASLRLPPGVRGTVVDVKIFSRRGIEKDERALAIEQKEIESYKHDFDAEKAIIESTYYKRLKGYLLGQTIASKKDCGTKIDDAYLASMHRGLWRHIEVEDNIIATDILALNKDFNEILADLNKNLEEKIKKLKKGDELPPGVLKMVKVYVADKRKLQVGDKLAGRHGNKGIVSRIVPVEDMPHMEDGTPLDIILNPLGVTSRMNIGQILETHLGWASKVLGRQVRQVIEKVQSDKDLIKNLRATLKDVYETSEDKSDIDNMQDFEIAELASNVVDGIPVATPVFDGAHEQDIVAAFKKTGVDVSGQVTLIDGRTGEPFDRKITVGCIYMLKLHHMVDDKIHARSIGPYSLVTQQPLGGKAQFGGQRFGEMEVWALQAYGAAYTLQEILTVKSDDVTGRTKAYESIIKGDENIIPGIPESFNVLMKELCGLGLNFEFQQGVIGKDTENIDN